MSNKNDLGRISQKYAQALAAVKLDVILLKELKLLAEIAATEDFKNSFFSPKLESATKIKLIDATFSGFSPELLSTLKLLVDKRRLEIVGTLYSDYKSFYNEANGIAEAQVSSARQLDSTEIESIKSQLESVFSKKVEIETNVDESLIAGIKVNLDDKVIDSSLKTKLREMRSLLLK